MKKHIFMRLITLVVLLSSTLQAAAATKVQKTVTYYFDEIWLDNDEISCYGFDEPCWQYSGGDASSSGSENGLELTLGSYGGTARLLSKATFPETVKKVIVYMGAKAYATSEYPPELIIDNQSKEIDFVNLYIESYPPYWSGVYPDMTYDDYTFTNVSTDSDGHLEIEFLNNYIAYFYIRSITVQYEAEPDPEPYAVLSKENTKLTFYYNNEKPDGALSVGPFNNLEFQSWYSSRENITSVVFDASFANCTSITSTAYWFYDCTNLTSIKGLEYLKTDNVTEMNNMFSVCYSLASLDVSNFNTEKVTNMSAMFSGCSGLKSLDVSKFNTSNVKDMSWMFFGCSGLSILNLSNFNTAKVTSMTDMFSGCTALTKIKGTAFNTANVTSMDGMFEDCSVLKTLDLSSFNTANVTDMKSMFANCPKLKTIYVGENWTTEGVTSGDGMFTGCTSLVGGAGTEYNSAHTDNTYALIDGVDSNPGYLTSINDAKKESYAVLSNDNKILTFYYDGKILSRGGMSVGPFNNSSGRLWNNVAESITSVIFDSSFANCAPLTSTAYWFYGCKELTDIIGIEKLNTASVADMNSMFYGCSTLTNIDLGNFNTANVTDMKSMFESCSSLKTIYVGENWTTEGVTSGDGMFTGCASLVGGAGTEYNPTNTDNNYAHIDGGASNPGYLTDLNDAPKDAYALLNDDNTVLTFYYDRHKKNRGGLGIEPFQGVMKPSPWYDVRASITEVVFDASIANCDTISSTAYWFLNCENLSSIKGFENLNTANVTSMRSMFAGCSNLKNVYLSNFNTANVANLEYMFYNCSNLTTIYVGSGWATEAATSGTGMFEGSTSLMGGAGTAYNSANTDQTYARIDGGVDSPGYFTDISTVPKEPYAALSKEGTVVTFYYDHLKESRGGIDINQSNISNNSDNPYGTATTAIFDTTFANYSPTSTAFWFMKCSSLTSISGMENLKTDNVKNMTAMFYKCTSLSSLDLSNFNTEKVTYMGGMFDGCSSLTSLNLSSFKTNKVTSMGSMFYRCTSLSSLDLSNFNTEKVTTMNSMFFGCTGLTSLVLSNFNTERVTDMYSMFSSCFKLTSLDLSNFNTEKVTSMYGMFYECSELTTIYAGDEWSTAKVTDGTYMFNGCAKLVGGNGTTYNSEHEDYTYARIDYGIDKPGYFTDKSVSDPEAYAELTENEEEIEINESTKVKGKTLTFYYDKKKKIRKNTMSVGPFSGYSDQSWYDERKSITSVVFERTFASCDTLSSTANWFFECSNLKSLGGLANFKTDNVKDMTSMFEGCKSLKELDLGNFKTGNVEKMSGMFGSCDSLENINLILFNTENVTDMWGMFSGCSSIKTLDLTRFNTQKVKDMGSMFYGCSSLKTIYVGLGWDTKAVTDKGEYMFSYCESIAGSASIPTTYDSDHTDITYAHIDGGTSNPGYLSEKDPEAYAALTDNDDDVTTDNGTVKGKTLTFYYDGHKAERNGMSVRPFSSTFSRDWFDLSTYITTVVFDKSFDNCTTLTSTAYWFYNCRNLNSISGLNYLHTDSVTNMSSMFLWCQKLKDLDVSMFNTAKVTDMSEMFLNCSSLTSIDVSNFDTRKVTNMESMFECCSSVESLNLSGFVTENVTNMSRMFRECSKLTSLDFSSFNTAKVTDMNGMFFMCTGISSLDLSKFITANVTNMSGMFYRCYGLNSLDVSSFNTKQVTDMSGMFRECTSLTSINVRYFETESVIDMREMFDGCSGISNLDISSFNTKKVTDMWNMFYGCTNLQTIYVGDEWNTDNVPEGNSIFYACGSLVGGAGTKYDSSHTDVSYAHIDGGEENPGYLTKQKEQVKTPTFRFDNENLILETETEGATILYEIKEYNNNLSNDSIAKIAAKMTISDAAPVYKNPILIDKDVIVLARGTKEGMENSKDTLLIYPYTEWMILIKDIVPMGERTLQDAKGNDMIPEDLLIMLSDSLLKASDNYSKYRTTMTRDGIRDMSESIVKLIQDIESYIVVTITAKNYTREYGAATPEFEYTVEGGEISGTPVITCAATDTTSVGTYPITIAYTKAESESKWNVKCVDATLTITKAPLTITAKDYTIKRGEAIPTLEATYSGLKNNETDTVFTKKPLISTEAKPDTLPGTYPIVASGAEAKNYEMSYVDGTLTITDDVTVTANSYTRVYGDDNPTFEFTSEGATLSGTPTITCSATATSPVGIYDIVIAKGDITNSTVTCVNGTLTITKAPLTITAKSYTIKQGRALPTLEAEYSGFKNNETDTVFTKKPIVSTNATSDSEPGTYDITVSGAEATNYEMTYVNGILTITKKTESFDGIVLVVEENGNIDDAFESCGGKAEVAKTIAAVVWNDTTELKAEMLDGISNPNLLIYVGDEKLAPSGFNNVVINGVAKNIKLTDGGTGNYNFYVPQEFKADSISYSREFKQATRDSVSRGWEGIALPFTVQTFTHEEHGNISPFGNDACDYHFWLRQPTENGVVSAKTIEANKPYIISMPNSDEYEPEFNHAGWITFASASVTVPVTDMEQVLLGDSAWIMPTFLEVEQSPDLYVLNVGDSIQYHPEGSIFISNYRSARPFEVYAQHEGNHNRSGVRVMSLSSLFRGGKGTTDMGIVTIEPASDAWFDLNGRRLQSKPSKSGLYIHNGKKVLVK